MSNCKPNCNNITLPTGLQKGDPGIQGPPGISINWLGDLSSNPANPDENDAYYNTTDGESYIYDGSNWQTLAKDGITPNAEDIYNHAILASTEESESRTASSGGIASFDLSFSLPPAKEFTSGSIIEIKTVFSLSDPPTLSSPNPIANPTTIKFDGRIFSATPTNATRFIDHTINHIDGGIIEIYSRVHINDISVNNDKTAISSFEGFYSSVNSPIQPNKQSRVVNFNVVNPASSTGTVQYEISIDNQLNSWNYDVSINLISSVITQTVK